MVMKKKDDGFTLIELLIVVAIISIIAAMAVPGLMRNRMAAQEVSAVGTLEAITKAQYLYATTCGNGGFATSLATLGVPSPGTGQPFLTVPELTSGPGQKTGYIFTLTTGAGAAVASPDCNGTVTATGYYATAVPMTFGSTGSRSFASNEDKTVWQVNANVPPTQPFGPPAVPTN